MLAEQEQEDGVFGLLGVADESVAEFALHPAADAGGADEDEEVGGGFEGRLEGGDPFLAGQESFEFEPDVQARLPQRPGHGVGGIGVLGGVAEEDGGHGTERASNGVSRGGPKTLRMPWQIV